MHIADVAHGNPGATGIVAGNIPVAVGAARAQKLQGRDRVVLCFFGDGAANAGNFHESLNLASAWGLPMVFVVENSMYAMSVPWAKIAKLPNIADRACAYPGVVVDGMDVVAVRGAVAKAIRRARQAKGPSFIEAKTYRWYGHSHSDPRAYRSKNESDHKPGRILAETCMSNQRLYHHFSGACRRQEWTHSCRSKFSHPKRLEICVKRFLARAPHPSGRSAEELRGRFLLIPPDGEIRRECFIW